MFVIPPEYIRKWLGLVLALAVTLHALLPFYATYQPGGHMAANAQASSFKGLLGDKIIICTASGFALVSLKDLLSGKAPVKPHSTLMCALCYVASSDMGKALVVVLAWLACLGLLMLQAKAAMREDTCPNAPAAGKTCPRAPPAC